MKFPTNNKGSAAVMLCILFSSFVFLISIVLDCAGKETSRTYSERMMRLSARSILAEYDINLYKDYSIFGIDMKNSDIEDKIANYMKQMKRDNFKNLSKDYVIFDILTQNINVNCAGGSLFNSEIIMNQIKDTMKIQLSSEILEEFTDIKDDAGNLNKVIVNSEKEIENEKNIEKAKKKNSSKVIENKTENAEKIRKPVFFQNNKGYSIDSDSEANNRVLRNELIIDTLPSEAFRETNNLISINIKSEEELMAFAQDTGDLLDKIADLSTKVKEDILLNEYIMQYMKNHNNTEGKKTFFSNEAEYILYGDLNDNKNYENFIRQLFIFRTGLNLLHIYSDNKKRSITLEAATVMTGGIAVGAVQLMICLSWAAAEASGDLEIIKRGGKVPLLKTAEEWRLSLENCLNGKTIQNTTDVNTDKTKGLDYSGYLRIMLAFKEKEVKLLRVMDLIQINMKGRYRKDFDLRNYIGRFSVHGDILCKQNTLKVRGNIFFENKIEIDAIHSY